MKKVLFATTALVATAGVAAAEVNFSGYGRFGLGYQEDRTQTTTLTDAGADGVPGTSDDVSYAGTTESDDVILVSRFRLNIDGIAETDGGVRFEGRIRVQADDDGQGEAGTAQLNGARYSVIFGGLRVDAGNIAGSFDNLANYYGYEVGLETFLGQYSGVDYSFATYSSTGAGVNGVFFQYAVGDFAFGASYDQAATITASNHVAPVPPATVGTLDLTEEDGDRWDISATYTFDNITAALAYGRQTDGGSGDDPSLLVFTLGAEFGDFAGTLFVADDNTENTEVDATDGTAYGLSVAYNVGAATTIQFVYGDGSADGDTRNVGIGAHYDLGGGVSLRGGIGQIKEGEADSFVRADFGAQFNF
ncbi:porin [Ruegeria sp.]|uniref:porin n=1 Tax=Ruegeria sp. TaxID=1879320 RepID=UPI003AFFEBA7